MKLCQLSEAQYPIGKPGMRHVNKVSKIYDRHATNGRYATDRGNRPSDGQIWDEGRPVINIKGATERYTRSGQGFVSLDFIFRDTAEDIARSWVKEFVSNYKIPYTNLESYPPRGQEWLADDDEIGNRPTYTRVVLKFEEHPQ